jgi:hypothetical protein
VRDYVWWSGMTVRDARAGIEMAGSALVQDVIEGRMHWLSPSRAPVRHVRRTVPAVYLLPNYDEYGIAYRDRDVIPSVPRPRRLGSTNEFAHLLVINGGLVGRWRRTLKPGAVVVEAQVFRTLTRSESAALDASVTRYGRFLNVRATVALV